MDPHDSSVRLFVYESFRDTGRAPEVQSIAGHVGIEAGEVTRSLERLQASRALALTPVTMNIWMAHPFSAVPTPHRVEARGRIYWANCAWDALAIPSLLGGDATSRGRCGDCGEPLSFEFRAGELVSGEGLVHFVVPPRRFWENVAYT
jgi:hypothetical protein